jgi:glutamate N-acetyltransferase/amino-acid N-acetyltransferase
VLPGGFRLSVAAAGIKAAGRNDMSLIVSDTDAAAAGVFTTNRVQGAPVKLSRRRIRGGRARAVLVNSGNANVCTGPQGARDTEEMTGLVARSLGVPEGRVLACSTGVIGVPLPMKRIRPNVGRLAGGLGRATLEDAARAIMTTDAYPKFQSARVGSGTLAGMCKGAGMIDPAMATMLAFFMTDLAVEPRALRKALREAVGHSFNEITVDGNRSTSDTVLLLANGMAGNRPLAEGGRGYRAFCRTMGEMAESLARMIVADGEGATKVVSIEVSGARNEAHARRAAEAVANSVLVKTALWGNDPNWGRIMAVLGSCGASMREEETTVSLGGVAVFAKGRATGREDEARRVVSSSEFPIRISLGRGAGRARVLTCDLTDAYVRFNAEYTT